MFKIGQLLLLEQGIQSEESTKPDKERLQEQSEWIVTFDQNVKNAISAEFGILAVGLPDWWFLGTRSVIGTFGQTVRAGIF